MNKQQLAAVKQVFKDLKWVDNWVGSKPMPECVTRLRKASTALQSIISQDALDKKADNARELGINYDTPLSSFVRSSDEDKAVVMERVIDKATEEQKALIGCVNHDCDQCKAAPVQEPVGHYAGDHKVRLYCDVPNGARLYTTPAAAPVPLTDGVTIPLEVLEAAEESLGSFCSDHGWSDKDMQNMDNLSAHIARHKAAHGITKGGAA
jgi:hypothetical protein